MQAIWGTIVTLFKESLRLGEHGKQICLNHLEKQVEKKKGNASAPRAKFLLASSRWPIGKKILHHHYYYYYTLVLCQTYSYVRVSGEMVVAFGMMIHRLLDSILFPSHWTRSVPNRVGIMNNKYVYERVKRRWAHTDDYMYRREWIANWQRWGMAPVSWH